ncbi:Pr6Pr family membrane protein [Streptomyces sp. NPDC048560]|uniref:Pr6Pr family membrane protein n=1 Tax=Streptomyces sp. NPDC048560 TaxID=3155488 RepID=UPI003421865D
MTSPRTVPLPSPRSAEPVPYENRSPRPFAAAFRALVCLAAVTGVVIDLGTGPPLQILSHFAIQANLLVAVTFAWSAHRARRGGPPLSPWLAGGVLALIAITGLVHHLILANSAGAFSMTDAPGHAITGLRTVSHQLLHTVTPLAAALDWLLLTTPRTLRLRFIPLWLLHPVAYLAFALTRGARLSPGSEPRYPYPFLDVDAYDYPGVLTNALALGLLFAALATLLVGLDRVRPEAWGPPPSRRNRISPPAAGGLK